MTIQGGDANSLLKGALAKVQEDLKRLEALQVALMEAGKLAIADPQGLDALTQLINTSKAEMEQLAKDANEKTRDALKIMGLMGGSE
jgi:hypothetical protein